jgi:hypothetical protein
MESEYGRRFWAIETLEEGQTVARLLKRRFPQVFESLSEIFEQADPLDVVYPGNPNEYSDVIREIIVLLAPVEGKIRSSNARPDRRSGKGGARPML